MAYKFQLGAASLAGTTTFKDGLSANDQNITNVGDINVDSISPDATEITMILTHDESSALEILNGTNGTSYMKFDTSNGADLVSMEVPLQIDDNKKLFFRDSAVHISSDADGHLQARADNTINLNINGTDRASVTSAGLDVVGALSCDTSLTIDTTAISAAEIGVLDSVTAGTAAASKAVVLDASKNITGINNLTVEGNLTVQGTTTQVDTTNLQVKDKNILINDGGAAASGDGAGIDIEEDGSVAGFIKVSGSRGEWHLKAPNSSTLTIDMDADGEIEFGAAKKLTVAGNFNIDADITSTAAEINLVDGSSAGTIVNSKAVIYGSSGEVNATTLQIAGSSITATAAELNLLDAGAGSSVAVAAGDGFIMFDATDSNSGKKVLASDIKAYVAGTNVYKLSGSGTVDGIIGPASGSGFYYNASAELDEDGLAYESKYLISGSGWTVGDTIRIKAPTFDSGGKISIFAQSSSAGDFAHSIENIQSDTSGSLMSELGNDADDEPAIVLESSDAAVTLIHWGTNTEGSLTTLFWSIV